MITRVEQSYKRNLASIIFGPFLKIIEAFFDLLIPLFMKAIIDLNAYQNPSDIPHIISSRLASFIRIFNPSKTAIGDAIAGALIILIMGIVGYAITMCSQYLAARASTNVGTEIRTSLYAKLLSLSKKEREDIGEAKLVTLLNSDTYQVQQGVYLLIRLIVRAPFTVIGSLVLSFVLDWRVGLAFTAIAPLVLLVNILILKQSSKKYIEIQNDLEGLSESTNETSDGARVIRASNQEKQENQKFEEKTRSYKEKSIKVNRLNALINPLTFAITSTVLIVIVLLLQNDLFENRVLVSSTIIAEMAFLAQIFFAFTQLSQISVEIVKAGICRRRINTVFAIESEITSNTNSKISEVKAGEELIKFENVSFSFNDGVYFLNNLNFEIRKGETFGIIGGTGSGKTTIINLIERFYDVSEGTIYYKGVPIREYDLKALRNDIGLVNQKSSLFNGTIKSNYLMSNKTASDEDIYSALKQAEAFEFVDRYEDKIDHPVKEGASNYSGGQKQRLCIGRALVKKPELLILDDSMSALDLLTDKKIRTNIAAIKEMTKVIVSQRISTIQNADFILVLEGGQVVGQGKHDDLLNNCPIYKEIYETQVKRS
ncbi:MAG: ABC transporter ATP-binding protein [Bacilli bacterium]|nr:ABC transporter ATP-binding protein [Bacilli bacterium]